MNKNDLIKLLRVMFKVAGVSTYLEISQKNIIYFFGMLVTYAMHNEINSDLINLFYKETEKIAEYDSEKANNTIKKLIKKLGV